MNIENRVIRLPVRGRERAMHVVAVDSAEGGSAAH